MRVRHPATLLFLLLGSALALTACGGGAAGEAGALAYGTHPVPDDGPRDLPPGTPPDEGGGEQEWPGLVNGVLVTIDTAGERWRWWVTNPETAQALEQVWNGNGTLGWFGGPLRAGPGEEDHNAPWSWHVDPQQNVADVIGLLAPEMARYPSDCESRLSYWLSRNAHFIPMDATIVEFLDRRFRSELPGPR